MGGINHQPCNQPGTFYLLYSTMMSRSISKAISELEQANIALENLIIAELGGNVGCIEPIQQHFSDSVIALKEMEKKIVLLCKDMKKHSFTDLPALRTTDLEELGTQFMARGIVASAAWNSIVATMRADGFYGVLRHFESRNQELRILTNNMINMVNQLHGDVKNRSVHYVLEENRPGNIKVLFARLYTRWSQFHQEFLASSILSTELWYVTTGVGSLLDSPREHKQVA